MTGAPVLLVDDDASVRDALAQTLDLADLRAIPAGSFVAAKDQITRDFPGVILSDIRMPGRDGFHLLAYAHDEEKLRGFMGMYNNLMLAESGLSKLEREMIAVAVSSANHCFYCLTAHGAAVRDLSGKPELGELLVMNYRVADLSPRQRAMLDFAVKMTETPDRVLESDRQALRDAGFSEVDIWDIAAVASFFNMTNRMAAAVDMMPNPEYHAQSR